jgi:6-phosphogluconolactonase
MQRITRRSFPGGASALTLAAHPWSGFASDPDHEQLLLVGTQTAEPSTSKDICGYRFNMESSELIPPGLAVEAKNPTFLVLGDVYELSAGEQWYFAVRRSQNA